MQMDKLFALHSLCRKVGLIQSINKFLMPEIEKNSQCSEPHCF